MIRKIAIGTRGSRLAMIQAESVAAKLRQIRPDIEIEIKKISTLGDRDRNTPLESWGEVGVFVKELETALIDRSIDLAVHSLKDMPADIPEELFLAAVTERQDPRDVLVAGKKLDQLPAGARIGTGSLRRKVQLRQKRPDLKVIPIRGNIDTRLKKVANGEVDGVIMAAAALLRLGWASRITEYLPVPEFLPEAGQGALAVEARTSDLEIAGIAALLNNKEAWQATQAERVFIKTIGGGCIAPVAALAVPEGGKMRLEGMVADMETGETIRARETGDPDDPDGLGKKLADKMIAMGALGYIEKARRR